MRAKLILLTLAAGLALASAAQAKPTHIRLPRVWATNSLAGLQRQHDLPQAQIVVAPPQGGCAWLRKGDVTATFSIERKTTTITATPCGGFAPFRTLPGLFISGELSRSPNETRVGLNALTLPYDYTADYRVRVTLDGRLLFAGKIEERITYKPAVRIYEGTDAFINYCINNLRPTYSSNLHLYCNVPSESNSVVTIHEASP